ncbi:MAG: hypothetical protein ACK4UQ_06670 [Brevundimonas sp.]
MTDESNTFREDSSWQRLVNDTRGMFGMIGTFFAVMIALGPLGMLGWQCLTWLQNGYWDKWPISRALAGINIDEPAVSWGGVQKIIHFLFQMPTSVGLMFIGLAGMMFFGWLILLIEKYHTADVRVSYSRDGQSHFKLYRDVVKDSEEQVVLRLYRDIPDGLWRITKIEWMPRA